MNAEKDFCEKTLAGEFRATDVPMRTAAINGVALNKFSAEESFILEQIDGVTDIRALLWISPLREVDALKALRRMLKKGWVAFRQAA